MTDFHACKYKVSDPLDTLTPVICSSSLGSNVSNVETENKKGNALL